MTEYLKVIQRGLKTLQKMKVYQFLIRHSSWIDPSVGSVVRGEGGPR